MLLPTTLVGSYPQPDGLIDRSRLASRLPPRVRAKELWRVAPELLEQAQDDLVVAPDCGLKYLPREVAFGKMRAMVQGAAIVRAEVR